MSFLQVTYSQCTASVSGERILTGKTFCVRTYQGCLGWGLRSQGGMWIAVALLSGVWHRVGGA